ncbi:MAG: LuxR C-terminal-related transcriptional regulator [Caulobacter sp.]
MFDGSDGGDPEERQGKVSDGRGASILPDWIRHNGRLVHRNDLDLPRRQKQCLRYWHVGKTAGDIGLILELSHRTVQRHLEDLRRSFDVSSCRDVIAKLEAIGRHDLFTMPNTQQTG